MVNKRAQFFLLAAVIISAVVISLGITANRAIVNKEPESFYDYSYEVEREIGAVLDYEIYTDFDEDVDLDDFVDLLADNMKERAPDSNFLFIYGSNKRMNLRNYGKSDAFIDDVKIVGAEKSVVSSLCIRSYCQDIEEIIDDFDDEIGSGYLDEEDMAGSDDISVEVKGHKFEFPISRHRKVIFLIQKDVKDESFISVSKE